MEALQRGHSRVIDTSLLRERAKLKVALPASFPPPCILLLMGVQDKPIASVHAYLHAKSDTLNTYVYDV